MKAAELRRIGALQGLSEQLGLNLREDVKWHPTMPWDHQG
jgi:hypothetical protein